MTISYSGNFLKLLIRWKGSIWKSVWRELCIFLILFYIVRLIYLFALTDDQQKLFKFVSEVFNEYSSNIPLTFLLGFYVTSIVKRWWEQFNWVAWPDDPLSTLCVLLPDRKDEHASKKRHMVARYLILSCALSWRDVSVKVRKRFPTVEHLVSSGLMTSEEKSLFNAQPENIRWFLPIQWAQTIVSETVDAKNLNSPLSTKFYSELNYFKLCCRKLYCYDWVCIPLVYTQVVTVATYGYFFCFCLLGRQTFSVESKDHELVWFPIFTVVQFLFYVGWLNVGQDLMRPFGTDDDDIELNYILDRHVEAAFALVDSAINQTPPLTDDRFSTHCWVPHTKISAKISDHPPKLHAYVKLKRPEDGEMEERLLPVEETTDKARRKASVREERKRWRKF